MDIKYHWERQRVEEKDIKFEFITSTKKKPTSGTRHRSRFFAFAPQRLPCLDRVGRKKPPPIDSLLKV
jgi:hypothetical protein